jgi:hypothetical protein
MAPQVNGEVPPASAFLDHLLKYPVINDSVTTFKQNHYGQKSLQLGDSAYKTFAQPVLPYFSKPYQYVSPYVKKVDSLGDQTLSQVDARFPVVKKPTGELYADAKSVVLFPLRKGMESKDHVLATYGEEHKKVGGPEGGLMTYPKAFVTGTLILCNESVAYLTSILNSLNARKAEAKAEVHDKVSNN